MSKRPPSLAERLRDAWHHVPADTVSVLPGDTRDTGPAARTSRGSEFADRLRAAVAARH